MSENPKQNVGSKTYKRDGLLLRPLSIAVRMYVIKIQEEYKEKHSQKK